MKYSQLCVLFAIQISPVFMWIQHQVEAIPVKTSLTGNRKLIYWCTKYSLKEDRTFSKNATNNDIQSLERTLL